MRNSDFEGGYREVKIYEPRFWAGLVPNDWEPWFYVNEVVEHDHENEIGWCPPEFNVIKEEAPYLDPDRIAHGHQAVKIHSSWKIFDAGLYQKTTLELPQQFYMLAHSWDSEENDPHSCDPRRNIQFRVGVDPEAGEDPFASSVLWGPWTDAKCEYTSVPGPLIDTGGEVTVYLRARSLWGWIHLDAYIDYVSMEPVLEERPCKGNPRVDYRRTVNVYPGDTTEERYTEIAKQAFKRGRQTVSGSYDDAGIGNLTDKAAVLWDIPGGEKQDFLDFFLTHYPGTEVVFEGEGEGTPPPPAPSPLSSNWLIGLHTGYVRNQTLNYLRMAKPTVQKFFTSGDCFDGWLAAPNTYFIYRNYWGNEKGRIFEYPSPKDAAEAYVDRYLKEIQNTADNREYTFQGICQGIQGVESFNETIGTHDPLFEAVLEAEWWFAEHLYRKVGDLVAPVLLNVAVGNPHESEVPQMVDVAKQIEKYNGRAGYHGYWVHNRKECWLVRDWKHIGGRWTEWDKVFLDRGVSIKYALTEGGVTYSEDFRPRGNGWKSVGSYELYHEGIVTFNNKMLQWNAKNDNRCTGLTLFGYGNWGWDSFELGDGEVLLLIEEAQRYV